MYTRFCLYRFITPDYKNIKVHYLFTNIVFICFYTIHRNRLGFGIFLGASANRAVAATDETNSTEYEEYEDLTTESTPSPYPITTTDADSVTERMISNSAPYQRSMSPSSDYKYTYEPSYHFVNVTGNVKSLNK